MLKVRNGNYYQQKLQNNYFQPKVLLLAQPLACAHLGGVPVALLLLGEGRTVVAAIDVILVLVAAGGVGGAGGGG